MLSGMILFIPHQKKCYLTGNSLNFFHLILERKNAYHFKRMRKLSYLKMFKAILFSLAPTPLVHVSVTEIFEFSTYLLVVFSSCCTRSFLQWGKEPIVVVKREEAAWQKNNANNESEVPKKRISRQDAKEDQLDLLFRG